MSKLITVFQALILLLFFTDNGLKANPVTRCVQIVQFQTEMESLMKLEGEERLNQFCINMPTFFRCINDLMISQTGMTMKELAKHWLMKGTEAGKIIGTLVNMEEFVEEICAKGSKLHEQYLVDGQCLQKRRETKGDMCKDQAANAIEIYKQLPTEKTSDQHINECVTTAYYLGCLGAALHEECGGLAFERYKYFVKKTGFFKSGICSSDLMRTLNTTFVDSLDMSDSKRSLFRTVFSSKKRRK